MVPLVEIWTIIQVGQVDRRLVDDRAAGAERHPRVLAGQARGRPRLAGAAASALAAGRLPHRELADGILILVGGTLMLTPGFFSDVVGILMHPAVHPPAGAARPGRGDQPTAGWPGVPPDERVAQSAGFGSPRLGPGFALVTPAGTDAPDTTTPRTG